MHYLNSWHPFELIRFDPVKITMRRCLVLQIWEQQKQLLQKQRCNPTSCFYLKAGIHWKKYPPGQQLVSDRVRDWHWAGLW